MGEFSFIKGIKSVQDQTPAFCARGIKISEHLGPLLKQLSIDYGGKEVEMDVINISCDGDKVNILLGECKVTKANFKAGQTFFSNFAKTMFHPTLGFFLYICGHINRHLNFFII
jgi:hypothetical protein